MGHLGYEKDENKWTTVVEMHAKEDKNMFIAFSDDLFCLFHHSDTHGVSNHMESESSYNGLF